MPEMLKMQRELLARIVTMEMNILVQFREQSLADITTKEARKWLCALNSSHDFQRKADEWLEGTCNWILEDERFQDWMSGSRDCKNLWIVGIAGLNTL